MNDTNYTRFLSEFFGVQPSLVDGVGNSSFLHYRRYLYSIIYSKFKFDNFPESWDIDYLRDVLFQEGVMSICDTDVGVLALRSSYNGVSIYEKPTHMVISNPVLGTLDRTIGIDCEPLYFEYMEKDYMSMESIVRRYAVMLAQCDASLNVNLINTRMPAVFSATRPNILTSMKQAYDDVTRGVPALFTLVDEKNKGNVNDLEATSLFNNVKNSFIGKELLETRQTIINDFLTYIGFNNNANVKKERMIVDEVNANNEVTKTLANMWKDNINSCFDRARVLFPELKVKCYFEDERSTNNELT